MTQIAVELGTIGEHICALRLLKSGVACSIVNLQTVDVIAHDYSRVWRIQVKSSSLRVEKGRKAGYHFSLGVGGRRKRPLTPIDCDIVALVSIEHEQVVFLPVAKLDSQKTKRMLTKRFLDPQTTIKSWEKCMDYFA
jgi:hypothetical protein